MNDTTARLRLPMLRAGQAQKELSHNEALAMLDLLIQASVVGFAVNTPPAAPSPGDAWVVGSAPVGAWAGRADQLAGWTEGGWRFTVPIEGMTAWISEASVFARFSSGGWSVGEVAASRLTVGGVGVVGARQPAVASPAGGTTIDVQARATLTGILTALRAHGLISP